MAVTVTEKSSYIQIFFVTEDNGSIKTNCCKA